MQTRVLLASLVVACGGSSSTSTVTPTRIATLEVPVDKRVPLADVRLFDHGSDPRRPLRFEPDDGLAERGTIEMVMSMAVRIGEMAAPEITMPPMTLSVGMRVTDVAADGTCRAEFVVDDVSVADDGSALSAGMQQELGSLRQLRGWSIFDRRGRTLATDFTLPADASPQVVQMLESTRDVLTQLQPPFPEEEVGIGARWETITQVQSRIDSTLTAHYQLVDVTNEDVTLEVEVQGTAAPQPMDLGQPGATAFLDSMATTARGSSVLNLRRLWPRTQIITDSQSAIRVQQAGVEQHVETRFRVTNRIAPI